MTNNTAYLRPLSSGDISFILLLSRSKLDGDTDAEKAEGWRAVSSVLWPLVEQFKHRELIEVDGPYPESERKPNRAGDGTIAGRVRLTPEGKVLEKWLPRIGRKS